MDVAEFIRKVLSDNEGNPSSLRVLIVLMGTLFSLAFSFVWTYVSISNHTVTDIPGGVLEFIGIVLLGKSLQKGVEVYGENKKNNGVDSPTAGL